MTRWSPEARAHARQLRAADRPKNAARNQRIIELYHARRMSLRAIAREVGLTAERVRQILLKLGRPASRHSPAAKAAYQRQRDRGVLHRTEHAAASAARKEIQRERRDLMVQLRRARVSFSDIASIFETHAPAVIRIVLDAAPELRGSYYKSHVCGPNQRSGE